MDTGTGHVGWDGFESLEAIEGFEEPVEHHQKSDFVGEL